MLSGAAVATIRDVRKTDGSWEIFAAFCVAGAAICAVPAARGWVAPTPFEWLLLVVVGLTSVVGQLLMTHALRYVRAAVGGIIAQLTPVTSLAFGWVLFGDRIGGLALAGAALTLAGVSVGAYLAAGREADRRDDRGERRALLAAYHAGGFGIPSWPRPGPGARTSRRSRRRRRWSCPSSARSPGRNGASG